MKNGLKKIAKSAGIMKVNQTKTTVEMIFTPQETEKINGEKLFMMAYEISPYFKFNYHNKCLGVVLETVKLPKHYIFYLIDLLCNKFENEQ